MTKSIDDNLTVLVVDDEPVAVRGLSKLLNEYDGVNVVGTAGSGNEAVQQISQLRPEVVLLDIQMPDLNGFEVLSELEGDMPFIVFVTAHHEFALQAFEVHAVNYILKPVDERRLFTTLERVRSYSRQSPDVDIERRTRSLLNTISAGDSTTIESPRRLSIKSQGAVVFLSIDQLTHIESAGNYVRYHVDGECYLSRATMADVQRRLDATTIVRVHRSWMINTERIQRIAPHPNGEFRIELDDGVEVVTGHSYRHQVRRIIRSVS